MYEGQSLNQFNSRTGTDFFGRGYKPGQQAQHVASAGGVIVYGAHLSAFDRQELGAGPVVWYKEWGGALAELASRYRSRGSRHRGSYRC